MIRELRWQQESHHWNIQVLIYPFRRKRRLALTMVTGGVQSNRSETLKDLEEDEGSEAHCFKHVNLLIGHVARYSNREDQHRMSLRYL